ncbi:hypothetical protein LAZ40_03340 [Cereibacter sphaeroides]|uniref:hypothetical protein n=1 Tax=Cereibacter sphaeroides TaxID=1063 RepID=UPI001F167F00|nr:hypothetical protein [Cereibacter sphaeroides]MCE6958090.1 hypothetical protein [Cereibacter sphaeroides]MCE6971423.1 hypothetical protein [Cereibacter sphaeroides]
MKEAGYGDWGEGPAGDALAHSGVLAELDGQPVACLFLYAPPSWAYAMVFSAICDVSRPPQACFRGLVHAAVAVREQCEAMGAGEVVSYVRTPAVVKAFELAGFARDPKSFTHVYLSEERLRWLDP